MAVDSPGDVGYHHECGAADLGCGGDSDAASEEGFP